MSTVAASLRSRGDIETAKKSDLRLLVLAVTLGKLLAFLRTTRSVTRARPLPARRRRDGRAAHIGRCLRFVALRSPA